MSTQTKVFCDGCKQETRYADLGFHEYTNEFRHFCKPCWKKIKAFIASLENIDPKPILKGWSWPTL